jgi:hypothetical protein
VAFITSKSSCAVTVYVASTLILTLITSISHQLLSLYGTGASPEDIQKGYNDNAKYQRDPYQLHSDQIEELKDFAKAKGRLGKEE